MERTLVLAMEFGNAQELIIALQEAVAAAGGDGSVIYVSSDEDGFSDEGTLELVEKSLTDGSAVYDIVLRGSAE